MALAALLLLGAHIVAPAQVTPQATGSGQSRSEEAENVPRVPGVSTLLGGFNAGVSFFGVHNSAIGWFEVASPAVSYTFSPRFSADASTPIYLRRYVEQPIVPPQTTAPLVLDVDDAGDTLIDFHAYFNPHNFMDTATASLTAPTGNRAVGFGAGQPTFDFDNHVQRYARQAAFLLDLGIGDSSTLVNNLVTKNYTSVGKLAHFQTGAMIWIFRRYSLQSVAYEELPFGSQTVYTVVNPPRGAAPPGPGASPSNVITSTGASEDNGFTTSAGIPLTAHLTLSGYYNRSLRQHQDTVSMGMTYVLRGTPIGKRLSEMDRALREAAGVSGK
jgi:hypothetical protein